MSFQSKIDEELLLSIFRISSPSNKEEKMQEFIKTFLSVNGIDFETDHLGNISNFKIENAPLLSCHMDTVEDSKDSALMHLTNIYEDEHYGRYLRGYGVIGGDDKCGVFVVLSLLRKYPNKYNFVFSVNEEHGMTGIKSAVAGKDFSKILYGVVIDRRGAGDIICTNNSYGTKEFEDELKKLGEEFDFKPASGAASDANTIRDKISCANISSGYYNPHSKKEFVVLDDLQNTLNFVEKIITTLVARFPAPEVKTYSSSSYHYKYCKLCLKNEDKDKAELIWVKQFSTHLCKECAKKIIELANEESFVSFSKEEIKIIPINSHRDNHETSNREYWSRYDY